MKKLILILFTSVLSISAATAQSEGTRFGFRFGIGQANVNDAGFADQRGRMALSSGLTLNHQFTRNFGLMADLLYTMKGTEAVGVELWEVNGTQSVQQYRDIYTMDYIELPVMAKYSAGWHNIFAKFYGGPSVGVNVRAFQTRIYQNFAADQEAGFGRRMLDGRNLMEIGATFGTGFDFEAPDKKIFRIDLRNFIGLTPMGVINNRNAYNNYFLLSVGYLW
ncbi:MAG: porin family protein [Cytophagaceae bacterium]